jgi:hypothetical protein
MQKSGVPIAERPNLLLKGSGRVNRVLGPEEDLAGSLEKSLRQARRKVTPAHPETPALLSNCGK